MEPKSSVSEMKNEWNKLNKKVSNKIQVGYQVEKNHNLLILCLANGYINFAWREEQHGGNQNKSKVILLEFSFNFEI